MNAHAQTHTHTFIAVLLHTRREHMWFSTANSRNVRRDLSLLLATFSKAFGSKFNAIHYVMSFFSNVRTHIWLPEKWANTPINANGTARNFSKWKCISVLMQFIFHCSEHFVRTYVCVQFVYTYELWQRTQCCTTSMQNCSQMGTVQGAG